MRHGRSFVFALMAVMLQALAAHAQVGKNDFVLILVSGDATACTQWGYSGSATIYSSVPNGNQPTFPFVKVVENVRVERRSAKALSCGQNDYMAKGHIPPGVYALFYRRFDTSNPPLPAPGRHRLGLQDMPCNIPGKCTQTLASPDGTVRTALQFHVTANDLATFDDSISEGCITMRQAQWNTLFPPAFTTPATSPLVAFDPASAAHAGSGRVLVFVTDVTDNAVQQAQLSMFAALRTVAISPQVFESGAALKTLSQNWRKAK